MILIFTCNGHIKDTRATSARILTRIKVRQVVRQLTHPVKGQVQRTRAPVACNLYSHPTAEVALRLKRFRAVELFTRGAPS